ncbi:MAG: hypothetical protein AB7S41_10205 [Parvibaculaceae bacterium]
MIIVIDNHGKANLTGTDDFRRFEILVENPQTTAARVAAALSGLGEMEGDGVAWISEPALIKLAGRDKDAEWLASFSAMKDYARRFGWVDDTRSAIRAHIKRPGG